MDRLELLDLARREFARRLAVVRSDQLDDRTGCDDWTVLELARHVIIGDHMAVALLGGASRDETMALIPSVQLSDDLDVEFERAADAVASAFAAGGDLEQIVHHPAMDVSAGTLLGFRTGDYTLHAWDLARATEGDEQLDVRLVQAVWDALSPMADFLGQTGRFGEGPSGTLQPGADLQTRLLDLSGRRPS